MGPRRRSKYIVRTEISRSAVSLVSPNIFEEKDCNSLSKIALAVEVTGYLVGPVLSGYFTSRPFFQFFSVCIQSVTTCPFILFSDGT